MSLTFMALSLNVFAAKPTSPLVVNISATAPTIDADATDAAWISSDWQPINIAFAGEEAGFGDKGSGSADDLTAKFKVAFDNAKIYFLLDVIDDLVIQDPGQHWIGDKLEIYFGLPGYDETAQANADHARQFAIKAQQDPTEKGAEGSANYPPASDALATNGVTYAFVETGNGYVIEVSIDRAIALEEVPNNSTLGFDISIVDNDEPTAPGIRYRKSWYNDGYINELWGAMLGAGKLTLTAPTANLKEISQRMGHSLVNNTLTVNTILNANIDIYDMTGKLVLSSINTNKLNVAKLNAGIYVANVKNTIGMQLGNFRFVNK